MKFLIGRTLTQNDRPNGTVYKSYDTVVAVSLRGRDYVTEEKYSSTTSRHVNVLKRDYLSCPEECSEERLRMLAEECY